MTRYHYHKPFIYSLNSKLKPLHAIIESDHDDDIAVMNTRVTLDGFCLKTALVLGAYSFDIYNDPMISKTSTGLDGTSLTFHSTDIISKICAGVLLCTLRSGKFESKEENEFAERLVTGQRIDPYVKFWLDESKTNIGALRSMDSYTSKVKQDTETPVWNETFTLYVQNPQHANLHLNVSDKDMFSEDDNLGQGILSLQRLIHQEQEDTQSFSIEKHKSKKLEASVPVFIETGKNGWFSRKKKTKSGSIIVDVEYIPWKHPQTGMGERKKTSKARLPKGASPGLVDWEYLLLESLELSSYDRNENSTINELAATTTNTNRGLIESMKHKLHHALSIENKDTDTQAALWADFDSKNLVLSFRGTEQIKIRDIMTDINLFQSHYFPNTVKMKKKKITASTKNANAVVERNVPADVKSDVLCHTGFLSAFRSISPSLLQVLYAIFTTDEEGNDDDAPWQIHITGHSLGE